MNHRSSWRALASLSAALFLAAGCRALAGGARVPDGQPAEPAPRNLQRTPTALARTVSGATETPVRSAAPPTVPSPAADETPPRDGLTERQASTLASLQKNDAYPLYTMQFEAGYVLPVDASQLTGAPGVKRTNGGDASSATRSWGCSLFAAMGGGEGTVYGRNFDWQMSPALLLYTDPPDGFSSVSIVDIAYLFDDDDLGGLTDLPLREREALLEAPYWPFDGMNEHGLIVGMAAVPDSSLPREPGKQTIDSLMAIRLMLDLARDVHEAVGILGSYNIDWGGGPALHYLIADRSGRSVLVEYIEGRMVVMASEEPWHLATNHLRANVAPGAPSGCWQYDTISNTLSDARGGIGRGEAMNLLQLVSQPNTQWSVVYSTVRDQIDVVVGRRYGSVHTFTLPWQPAGSSDCPPSD